MIQRSTIWAWVFLAVGCGGSSGSDNIDLDSGNPACVAAGGHCIGAGGTCPGQTDPTLVDTCGDPNLYVCCAPVAMDAKAPDAAPEEAATPNPDAAAGDGGIVWTGPPPDPGTGACEIMNPMFGGGCVCEQQGNGHLYAVTCENDTSPCTCTVDGAPKKQIPNLCEGPSTQFYQLCGFP
jgi:hypothetical protein